MCIKPYGYSQVESNTHINNGLPEVQLDSSRLGFVLRVQGSVVYLERAGNLTLLLAEEDHARAAVRCFGLEDGALFVEAVPAVDIGRRITALRYELVPRRDPRGRAYPYLSSGLGKGALVHSYLSTRADSTCLQLRFFTCRLV